MKRGAKKGSSHALNVVQHFFPKVEEILDADSPIYVAVTKKDCDHADVRSHKTCALAVACRRSLKADGVIIGLTTSYIIKGKTATRYRLNNSISREITSFDRKAGFAVGLYSLTPISPANRLGTKRAYDPVRNGTGAGIRKPKFKHFTTGVRTQLSRLPEMAV